MLRDGNLALCLFKKLAIYNAKIEGISVMFCSSREKYSIENKDMK